MEITSTEACGILETELSTLRSWRQAGLLPFREENARAFFYPRAYIVNLRWWAGSLKLTRVLVAIYHERYQATGPATKPLELLPAAQMAARLHVNTMAISRRVKANKIWHTNLYGQEFFDPAQPSTTQPKLALKPKKPAPEVSSSPRKQPNQPRPIRIKKLRKVRKLMSHTAAWQFLAVNRHTLQYWGDRGWIEFDLRRGQRFYAKAEILVIKSRLQALTRLEVVERLALKHTTQVTPLVEQGLLHPVALPNGKVRYLAHEVDTLVEAQNQAAKFDGIRAKEAAEALRVPPETLRDWGAKRIIEHKVVNRQRLYSRADVDRLARLRGIFMGARSHHEDRPLTGPEPKTMSKKAVCQTLKIKPSPCDRWAKASPPLLPYRAVSAPGSKHVHRVFPQIYVEALKAYAAKQGRPVNTRLARQFRSTDQAQTILHWL